MHVIGLTLVAALTTLTIRTTSDVTTFTIDTLSSSLEDEVKITVSVLGTSRIVRLAFRINTGSEETHSDFSINPQD